MQLGATGKFPEGKLDATDEGELNFAVGHTDEGNIEIRFGTLVAWVNLTPPQAIALAAALLKYTALLLEPPET